MPTTLEYLRMETRDIHQALHVHPALKPLHGSGLTLEIYRNALKGFYGFYAPMEHALGNFHNPRIENFKTSSKLNNLVADLECQHINVSRLSQMPFTDSLDINSGIAYLYLREGSALGGLKISKFLDQKLKLLPGQENKFFYGNGKTGQKEWEIFTDHLKQLDSLKLLDSGKVSLAAKALFERLHDWMMKYV